MVLKQLGQCLATKNPRDVQKYLLEDLNERETVKLRNKVLEGAWVCLDVGKLSTIPMTFQGALADAMLRHDDLLAAPIDPSRVPPLRHSDLNEFADSLKRASPAQRDMMIGMDVLFRFGECAVRADAQDAFALLKSEPDSAEESAAFAALMPAFPGCIQKNQKVVADKTNIRATIAFNYYRLAAAGQPTSASAERH